MSRSLDRLKEMACFVGRAAHRAIKHGNCLIVARVAGDDLVCACFTYTLREPHLVHFDTFKSLRSQEGGLKRWYANFLRTCHASDRSVWLILPHTPALPRTVAATTTQANAALGLPALYREDESYRAWACFPSRLLCSVEVPKYHIENQIQFFKRNGICLKGIAHPSPLCLGIHALELHKRGEFVQYHLYEDGTSQTTARGRVTYFHSMANGMPLAEVIDTARRQARFALGCPSHSLSDLIQARTRGSQTPDVLVQSLAIVSFEFGTSHLANLLPEKSRPRSGATRLEADLIMLALALVMCLCSLFYLLQIEVHLRTRLTTLATVKARLIRGANQWSAVKPILLFNARQWNEFRQTPSNVLSTLERLTQTLPSNASLDSVIIEGDSVHIGGTAAAPAALLLHIETSGAFHNTQFASDLVSTEKTTRFAFDTNRIHE